MQLRVRSITYLAKDINGYELVDPRGRDLPRFTAGAHIDLQVGEFLRHYSLWNDPAERRRYCIAVLREVAGCGGSRRFHDLVRVGDLVGVSAPRNDFSLDPDAERHVLIAGGIGIAPIMSMISELRRRGADFELHYCTHSAERTAFRRELAPLVDLGRVRLYHDGGDPARGLDIARVLRAPHPRTHLYYCGPPPMMAAARRAAREWPPDTVHCEYFTAKSEIPVVEERAFRVKLARSGGDYEVPVGETIVDALRKHGVPVRTSCELGYCGTCLTRYLAGEPDHRDQVLEESGRKQYLLICCSRSKTPVLELDL
ncbi:MAG TPA: PDR/VanB family oxidoreductase [Stellaceae bacterium]|nr:PDR/VanB family oxidoreductase [Stellaceae bacterium]